MLCNERFAETSEMKSNSEGISRVCKTEKGAAERSCVVSSLRSTITPASVSDNAAPSPSTLDDTDEDDNACLDISTRADPTS